MTFDVVNEQSNTPEYRCWQILSLFEIPKNKKSEKSKSFRVSKEYRRNTSRFLELKGEALSTDPKASNYFKKCGLS